MSEVIVARYKCCKKIFFACVKGSEDRSTRKEINEAIKNGHTVETVNADQFKSAGMGKCSCGGENEKGSEKNNGS